MIAIAVVVGIMIGVLLSFLLEYLDNSIKDEQDVERIMELPVLAVISTIDGDELKHIHACTIDQTGRGGNARCLKKLKKWR